MKNNFKKIFTFIFTFLPVFLFSVYPMQKKYLTKSHVIIKPGLTYTYLVKEKKVVNSQTKIFLYKSVMSYHKGTRIRGISRNSIIRRKIDYKEDGKKTTITHFIKKQKGIYFTIRGLNKPLKFVMYNLPYWSDKEKMPNGKGYLNVTGRIIGYRSLKVPYSRRKLRAVKVEIKIKVLLPGSVYTDTSHYYFVKNLGLVMQESNNLIYSLLKTSLGKNRGEYSRGNEINSQSSVQMNFFAKAKIRAVKLTRYYKSFTRLSVKKKKVTSLARMRKYLKNVKKYKRFKIIKRKKYPPSRIYVVKGRIIELKYSKKLKTDYIYYFHNRYYYNLYKYSFKYPLNSIANITKPFIYKKYLFINDIKGKVYCFNIKNRKKQWSNILPTKNGRIIVNNGFVYLNTIHPDNAIYCLNLAGHIVWRRALTTKRDKRDKKINKYFSFPGKPYIYKKVLLVQSPGGDIYGLLKSSGEILWKYKVKFKNNLPVFYANGKSNFYIRNGTAFFYDLNKLFVGIDIITGKVIYKRKVNLKMKYNHAILKGNFWYLFNHSDDIYRNTNKFGMAIVDFYTGYVIKETNNSNFLINKKSYAYIAKVFSGKIFIVFRELYIKNLSRNYRWNYLCVLSIPDFRIIYRLKYRSIQPAKSNRLVRDYTTFLKIFRNRIYFFPEGWFYKILMR